MEDRIEKIVSKPPPRIGPARLFPALRYSFEGLAGVWRTEGSFRQEVVLAAILIPLACILPLGALERLALVASVLLVLLVEIINSAIEATLDRISEERHALTKHAKDAGSAAVFMSILIAAITWGTIAGSWLWR